MNSNPTQSTQILESLKDGRALTPWEAMRDFGCMRLAARIMELKRAGYLIGDRWIERKNKFGTTVRFKQYFLDYAG